MEIKYVVTIKSPTFLEKEVIERFGRLLKVDIQKGINSALTVVSVEEVPPSLTMAQLQPRS